MLTWQTYAEALAWWLAGYLVCAGIVALAIAGLERAPACRVWLVQDDPNDTEG